LTVSMKDAISNQSNRNAVFVAEICMYIIEARTIQNA
jgi:hypothetical protein